MSGVDQQGNIVLPSGEVYNPQAAIQQTLATLSQMGEAIPMAQQPPSGEFGVNRFLTGQEAIPMVFDVTAPQYTPAYEPFAFTPGDFAPFLTPPAPAKKKK